MIYEINALGRTNWRKRWRKNGVKGGVKKPNVTKDVTKELTERQSVILEMITEDSFVTIPEMSLQKTSAEPNLFELC